VLQFCLVMGLLNPYHKKQHNANCKIYCGCGQILLHDLNISEQTWHLQFGITLEGNFSERCPMADICKYDDGSPAFMTAGNLLTSSITNSFSERLLLSLFILVHTGGDMFLIFIYRYKILPAAHTIHCEW